MDELDRLLAETMRDAEGHAPSDSGLLGSVHDRSRRYHRRRVVTVTAVSAAAAVLVAAIPFVTVLAARPEPVTPPVAPAPATSAPVARPTSAAPRSSTPRTSSPTSGTPKSSTSTSSTPKITLAGGWTAPAFPYTLPATDGMSAPVASITAGNPSAFFEATELRDHADVTVTVATRESSFTSPGTATPRQVRGHPGTLRTVDVQPAKQLTLTWKESANRWIRLATDDTYTPDQVVALADSLSPATVAVSPPFALDFSPAGLLTDTVSASRMTFRAPSATPGSAALTTVLRQRQQLKTVNQKIQGYDAQLDHRAGGVVLSVDVTDWNATLVITVSDGFTISDADLIKFAAGIRVLNRSNPE
ncbi:hypothetical protein [Actinoplanes palleronii]|uniref:Uncharacterized protein n=1 Tax=Actinoplanes palleronii TaxID=113570 RepID=A0ABQ4BHW2_9ACTN|nr:hypothetical protein [Actinoplanes palleronii]GIE70276.1 hypothetical protein Apa02nite_063840 [Actinoplanes palleronii]